MKTSTKTRVHKNNRNAKKMQITFNQEHRIDYVTGFHKRKLERQEKGKIFNEAKARKEKLAARSERRKQAQAMVEEYEENLKQNKEWLGSDSESDDDDDDNNKVTEYTGNAGEAIINDTVTTTCGSSTIEVSSLGLNSNHFIGHNEDFSHCKLNSANILKSGKFKVSKTESKKDTEDQSFSDLVKGAMKRVKKQAKKTGDKFTSKQSKKSTNIFSKKKKPMVTEL